MENKRGQGMSTSTIVLLILGLVVLVVLILGFTMGWGSIAPWLSSSNVDSLSKVCETKCSTSDTYDFCTAPRELKTEDETFEDVTCNYVVEEMPELGFEECPDISCSQVVVELEEGESLEDLCSEEEYEGETIQAMVDNKLETENC